MKYIKEKYNARISNSDSSLKCDTAWISWFGNLFSITIARSYRGLYMTLIIITYFGYWGWMENRTHIYRTYHGNMECKGWGKQDEIFLTYHCLIIIIEIMEIQLSSLHLFRGMIVILWMQYNYLSITTPLQNLFWKQSKWKPVEFFLPVWIFPFGITWF